jgi:hypothetical protein
MEIAQPSVNIVGSWLFSTPEHGEFAARRTESTPPWRFSNEETRADRLTSLTSGVTQKRKHPWILHGNIKSALFWLVTSSFSPRDRTKKIRLATIPSVSVPFLHIVPNPLRYFQGKIWWTDTNSPKLAHYSFIVFRLRSSCLQLARAYRFLVLPDGCLTDAKSRGVYFTIHVRQVSRIKRTLFHRKTRFPFFWFWEKWC